MSNHTTYQPIRERIIGQKPFQRRPYKSFEARESSIEVFTKNLEKLLIDEFGKIEAKP